MRRIIFPILISIALLLIPLSTRTNAVTATPETQLTGYFAFDTGMDPGQGYVCRVTTDGGRLNVRARPTTSSRIVTKLYNGTVVSEIGVRNGWSRIESWTSSGRPGRVLGWVLSVYLVCGE